MNGKTFISAKPHRIRKANDPASLARQKRFGLNCKLSKCINQIDEYKHFWLKAAKGKMSTYNAIQKANYPHINHNCIDRNIRLTPDSIGMDFSEYGFAFDCGFITLEFKNDTLGVVKDFKIDNNVMFAGVICLSNPYEVRHDEMLFINVKSDSEKVIENDFSILSIELNPLQMQTIESYSNAVFFFGFISKDKDGNIINEVTTFAEDLHSDDE